jgi:CHASE3 domain sensor protein
MWVGLALIVVSSLAHLWLEIDRGTRVAPQLKAGPELIAHTYEVIATARGLERAIQDAERGQRGYLITGDTLYLDLYRSGTLEAPARLAQLKQLTLGNTEQQRRWPVLEHQVNIKLAELKRALDVRERGGFEAARLIVQASTGLDAMNAIDRVIDAAVAAEREVRCQRTPAGGRGAQTAPGAESAVHHRLHAQRGHPPRPPRSRRATDRQAVYPIGSGAQGLAGAVWRSAVRAVAPTKRSSRPGA